MEKLEDKITNVLEGISEGIMSITASDEGRRLVYEDEALLFVTVILSDIALSKMWELCDRESIALEDRANMATALGNAVRSTLKTYTGLDTHTLMDDWIHGNS